jgi:hypothetical protein
VRGCTPKLEHLLKSRTLSVRMTGHEWLLLSKLADANDSSMGQVVRTLIKRAAALSPP